MDEIADKNLNNVSNNSIEQIDILTPVDKAKQIEDEIEMNRDQSVFRESLQLANGRDELR